MTPHDEVDERAAHLIALALLPGIGPATLQRCCLEADLPGLWGLVRAGRAGAVPALAEVLHRPGGAGGVTAATLAAAAAGLDPAERLACHQAAGRRVLVHGTPEYPTRLADDPAPPAVVFVDGDLDALDAPTVAIVGTRNATRAGRDLAGTLAVGLARVGVSVVSGLALGIDGAAHEAMIRSAAVTATGRPVGVVASGLDVAYPARHTRLHRDVRRQGLLVSEVPLGVRPVPWRFPARNRIIAGLADAVVVVESRSAGGSMLTAAEALHRDVPVLAVPGHPSAPASAGANDLIADGAILVRDLDDVLVAIGHGGARPVAAPPPPTGAASPGGPSADPAEAEVLAALGIEPLSLGELLDRVPFDFATASVALAGLEGRGLVARAGSWYERVTPPAEATARVHGRHP